MAISPFKTWSAGEVLTASDLNSSFTQITNNAADLVSPFTKNLAAGGFVITGLAAGANNGESVRYEQLQAALDVHTCDFRLSLTTATPVTTTDVTGATTIYAVPYKGNRIALYDGSATWNVRSSAEFSLALGTLTSDRPYDVFCYDNSGTPTLEFLSWTNSTTRATALTTQDGVLVKTGATTRRYLGTFYTTSTTATEDSLAKRFLFNYYNRVRRPMYVAASTNTWNYTTATIRQAVGSTSNQLDFVIGVVEDAVTADVHAMAANSNVGVELKVGIGVNSTSTFSTQCVMGHVHTYVAAMYTNLHSHLKYTPSLGRTFLAWNEFSAATGTTTWYGTQALAAFQNAIYGEVWA